ncbi:S8 family serine peptidase [Seonamhaeicola sediminis]|uniref:S8 family serine peptidase n=1 Tax=Seonamhaeicola sediminis TaxID=2528206 RepID=A0A562YEC0_9FLAO|nr:S8 family serine peptidase [Seonamhaeicola sediminis]TWO32869.1 S8 family serine peptidase [Seonamhaeicola sediminis]
MTKNYFHVKLIILLCLFLTSIGFSQTQKQIKQTTKNYNKEKLKKLETSFEKSFYSAYNDALKEAKRNNWPVKYKDGNTNYHLRKVLNGKPIYIKSDNANAAISTRTNYLHSGGDLGLNLEGQNMTVYLWEVDGIGLLTHEEYDGPGGTDRLSIGDDETTVDNHAAHVTGTLIAAGINPSVKGMAPQASAVGYNAINDLSEATEAALNNGMLLSNHSYGFDSADFVDDLSWYFGAYVQESKDWDDLMYNAPYYLAVFSAGNAGADDTSNSAPLGGNSSYDKLLGDKTSKNSLIVASGSDAVINVDGTLNAVTRSSFSSEGPTDDLRIKPDITGNGESLLSTGRAATPALRYSNNSGTSMSSPNVCGSLLLLQQHHNNVNGYYMKAATLKGLALHTADDMDAIGPDANSGWGLLNAKKAAETITENGFSSWISEETLTNTASFSIDVVSDGSSPLQASISWTDQGGTINPTGTVNNGIILNNDNTPALVNDLDIRITQASNTYMPWLLTAVDANAQGDNLVDPYERVDVNGASGVYTITVTHKGTLVGGAQNFSLIVTGLTSNFTFNTQTSDQIICTPNDAVYNFNYQQTGGGTTNFSLLDVPAGANSSILPNSLNANGTFDVTFSNLSNVSANNYEIKVVGDDGSETETKTIKLRVLHPDFTPYPQNLSFPVNGSMSMPTTFTLAWEENLNAESYLVEVSTDPAFSSILFSNTQTGLEYDLSGLTSNTMYYWRVRPSNQCNTGNYSQTYNFKVAEIDCTDNIFTATDFSDGIILETPGVTASAPVTVSTGGLRVDSVEASFVIEHTWVNDILIALESPTANGNKQVLLFESSCTIDNGGEGPNPGDGDNFDVTYSDSGSDLFCDDPVVPSISGTIKPLEKLSNFAGIAADGVWTLRIVDPNNNDGGQITAFSLNFCLYEENSLSNENSSFGDIAVWPNPTNGNINIKLNNLSSDNDIKVNIFDIQGRKIKNFSYKMNSSSLTKTLDLSNVTNGIYLLEIQQGNKKAVRKILVE